MRVVDGGDGREGLRHVEVYRHSAVCGDRGTAVECGAVVLCPQPGGERNPGSALYVWGPESLNGFGDSENFGTIEY